MKLPNGYGSVTKLKGNRRNPFWVKKTVGFNDKGHPIYETIGYEETREKGLQLLAQYNNEPWNLDGDTITLENLFDRWKEDDLLGLPKLGNSNKAALKSAFVHCKKYYKKAYKEIRKSHMQDCIDNCGKGYSTQSHIKSLFKHLDEYAFELDIIEKMYNQVTDSAAVEESDKTPFTEDEITLMWFIIDDCWLIVKSAIFECILYMLENSLDSINESITFIILHGTELIIKESLAKVDTSKHLSYTYREWLEIALIYTYTGFRLNELLNLEMDRIDLNKKVILSGSKTASGKGRIVPIHPRIYGFIERRVSAGYKYLFSDYKIYPRLFYEIWYILMDILDFEHVPHDARHAFRTQLDNLGANKVCIDMLMGHKSRDVGERVYTNKTLDQLRETVELLP